MAEAAWLLIPACLVGAAFMLVGIFKKRKKDEKQDEKQIYKPELEKFVVTVKCPNCRRSHHYTHAHTGKMLYFNIDCGCKRKLWVRNRLFELQHPGVEVKENNTQDVEIWWREED